MIRTSKSVIAGEHAAAPLRAARTSSGHLRWIAGMPAMLSIVSIALAVIVFGRSTETVPSWYRPMADDAFDRQDFRMAAVCYERILQSHPTDDAIAFALAQSLGAVGQADAADSLLARLAPLDREGYAPAQLALARRLLASESPSPNAVQAAERHLTAGNFGEEFNSQVNQTLAIIRALQNNWDQVNACVDRSTVNLAGGALSKNFYSRLSAIARQQGNEAEAVKWAARAD